MIASSLLWVVSLLKLMGGCTCDCGNHSLATCQACMCSYRWPTLYNETQGDSHMLPVEAFMTGIKMESIKRVDQLRVDQLRFDQLRVDQRIKMSFKDEGTTSDIIKDNMATILFFEPCKLSFKLN